MTYTQPLLLLFGALALVALSRVHPSRAKRFALAAVIGLLLISWPPADWFFALPLEARYSSRRFQPPPGVQAIVVLGSSSDPARPVRPYGLPDRETFTHCEHAAWLYREYGPMPVLACEGRQLQTNPSVMAELLRRAGVPTEKIWLEQQAKSTHENAVYGSTVLRSRGIKRVILVTDAQSMPRAAACFRKEQVEVVCAPTGLREISDWPRQLLPTWRAIYRNEMTLHETLALAWYRLRGWI